jgi:hypothetical protein
MRWAGYVIRIGAKRNAYRILMGNPDGKRPLGRPRRRCLDNIEMGLREMGWDGIDPAAGKFLNSCRTGGFSRMAQLCEVSYIVFIVIDVAIWRGWCSY